MRLALYALVLLVMTAPASAEQEEDKEGQWSELLYSSRAYLESTQAQLQSEYHLNEHGRWDIDQRTGQIVFSDDGVPAVVADIQFVGSYSTTAKTWLWAWASPSVLPALVEKMRSVREYGQQHQFESMVDPKWEAEEADGWDMAAIANYLLKAQGVYRPPSGNVIAFVVLTNIRKAQP